MSKYFNAPIGSKVITTPNVYMTGDACLEIVPYLCYSIWNMNDIKDCPNWWVLLDLDDVGSHVNALETLQKLFADDQILVMKLESGTLHVH